MFKLNNSFVWRSATTLVWACIMISGWYWTQAGNIAQVLSTVSAVPTPTPPDMTDTVALTRLLGATPLPQAGPGPGPADRFVLLGVVASKVGQGAALIAVDGKPAQPFKVGSMLTPGYVLVSVAPREAMLAEEMNSPVRLTLTLPLRASAQPSSAVQAIVPSVPGNAQLPASSASAVTGVSPLPTPNAAEQPPAVPGRADARRQPLPSLRRDDQRTQ